jgi:hypothetical protein
VSFLELGEAPDASILEFASAWGWFDSRILSRLAEFLLQPGYQPVSGTTIGFMLRSEHRERLGLWRDRSDQARALVSVAASLRGGNLGRLEDWHRLFPNHAGDEAPWRRVSEMQHPVHQLFWRNEERSVARQRMRDFINRWLAEADVRPKLEIMHADRQSVALGGNGLLGALAVQLLYTVCRTHGLETCSACGAAFTRNRRPAEGRRRYCQDCADDGAALRDASRAHARRRAHARERYLGGIPIREIAREMNRSPLVIRGWVARKKNN